VRAALLSILVIAPAAGCKLVYDGQYDDRATELEASREDFLPLTDQVQFFIAVGPRVYWESLEKPLDTPLLHSFNPTTNTRIDYEFTRDDTNIKAHFQIGDQLIIKCNSSTTTAFDATMPNRMIDVTVSPDPVSDECAIDGTTVYTHVSGTIRKWIPGAGPTTLVMDLVAAGVGTNSSSFGGMAVEGNTMVYLESGRLWQIDLATKTGTWLENAMPASGTIAFDSKGVVFDSQPGIKYTQFGNHIEQLMEDLIADGGYDLNFEHADVQKLGDNNQYTIALDHLVYRSTNGIFAYGFDTTKVLDVLLDRGTGFDASPRYQNPTVTSDGTLFVEDDNSIGSTGKHTIYRVDLTARFATP
jgi:hypothetical protein